MKLAQKGIVIAGLYQDIGSSILDATIYVSLFGQLYLYVSSMSHIFHFKGAKRSTYNAGIRSGIVHYC